MRSALFFLIFLPLIAFVFRFEAEAAPAGNVFQVSFFFFLMFCLNSVKS